LLKRFSRDSITRIERPSHPKSRPTIDDVARRAGVSPAAVSFAVNGRPGVGAETRARILRAAAELGWEPSAAARALGGARARAIGLVLARDPAELEADAFFVRFLSGLERTLAPRDHALLLQLTPARGEVAANAYERLAASGRVDGFVLTDVERDDPRYAVCEAAGLPAVVAGHPGAGCPFPWVETEHGRGMAAAAQYLGELGHERIGFLGGPASLDYVQVRLERWRAALVAAGREPGAAVCVEPAELLADAAARMLADGATAVACTSDVLALGLVAAARAAGRRVPDDLSVMGFDDSALAALAAPALTSVRVDYAEFGAAAAATLLALLDGEPTSAARLAEPELVVRVSTAPPP
jgi:LacI family transcriptional regulator, repressor for deo operon, udp, cdd, tsx, nupC, and nupG